MFNFALPSIPSLRVRTMCCYVTMGRRSLVTWCLFHHTSTTIHALRTQLNTTTCDSLRYVLPLVKNCTSFEHLHRCPMIFSVDIATRQLKAANVFVMCNLGQKHARATTKFHRPRWIERKARFGAENPGGVESAARISNRATPSASFTQEAGFRFALLSGQHLGSPCRATRFLLGSSHQKHLNERPGRGRGGEADWRRQ